ncbi:hypothetical protein GF386_02115 [Candidatus Pacearchaeota archaeon]|nr:hypothetical protein [Candidatus Pacearchaeota archaeon]MBD3282963.1 hypothetical protein [Candidatus Pacearchaeota archaeon]
MKIGEFISSNSERARVSFSALIYVVLFISIIYSFYYHLWRILFINLLLLVLVLMPHVIHKRSDVRIPNEFQFLIFVFILVSFFLGDFRGLVIQIFFGLVISFFGFIVMMIIFHNSKMKLNPFLIILFSFSLSITLGFGIELLKFYLKLFLNNPPAVVDYVYAMYSMTMVSIGAIIASGFGYSYMKGFRPKIIMRMVSSFKKKNPRFFVEKTDSPEEILKLIKTGESERIEFKSTLRTNLHTKEHDKKIEFSVLKTIVAFLNSEGGTLLIGVDNDGRILGIEKDRFQNNDKFALHFMNLLKEHIGSEYLPYLSFESVLIEEKTILKVDCICSRKPVYLRIGKDEEFYVRAGPASVQLNGRRLVDYVDRKFRE